MLRPGPFLRASPGGAKILCCQGAKQKVSERCAQQTVHGPLKPGMEAAQDHVVRDPGERELARPIAASKHAHTTDNRYETEEFDP
jgi:hypothetical protein